MLTINAFLIGWGFCYRWGTRPSAWKTHSSGIKEAWILSCLKILSNSHNFTSPSVICCCSKVRAVDYSLVHGVFLSHQRSLEGRWFLRLFRSLSGPSEVISRWALQPGAVSSPHVVLCSDGNGNEVKWSKKSESVTLLSSGGHLPVHCRRNNQVSKSSFPEKVNPTYHLCMISVGIDYH